MCSFPLPSSSFRLELQSKTIQVGEREGPVCVCILVGLSATPKSHAVTPVGRAALLSGSTHWLTGKESWKGGGGGDALSAGFPLFFISSYLFSKGSISSLTVNSLRRGKGAAIKRQFIFAFLLPNLKAVPAFQ